MSVVAVALRKKAAWGMSGDCVTRVNIVRANQKLRSGSAYCAVQRSVTSASPISDSFFFFSSRGRHTSFSRDWSSDVCSSDLRRQLLELDVEPIADAVGARLDEDVTATKVVALDSGQRNRDALTRLGDVDRAIVDLHAAHAHVASDRLGAQHVSGLDPSRPERAGGDGPDPAQREDAVDIEAGRRVVTLGFCSTARERRAQLVEACAC